jgi:hypothetical protein
MAGRVAVNHYGVGSSPTLSAKLSFRHVVQLVERPALTRKVGGSKPSVAAIYVDWKSQVRPHPLLGV